jgi:hypothetical protein
MEGHTIELLQNLRRVLELPPLVVPADQPEPATVDQPPFRFAVAVA